MPHPLESVRLKIGRAREHLHELDREFAAFLDTEPYLYRPVYDTKTGKHEIRAVVLADPPLRLGLIAGDAAHCLRSALDHLIYQLAALGPSGEKGRGEKTAFPIARTERQWRDRKKEWLKGVPAPYQATLEQLQPYGIFAAGKSPILALALLDDRAKHRVIEPVSTIVKAGKLTIHRGHVLATNYSKGFVYLDEGAVIVRFFAPPGTGDVQVEYEAVPTLAFRANEGEVVSLTLLKGIVRQVVEIVRAYSEAFDAPTPVSHDP